MHLGRSEGVFTSKKNQSSASSVAPISGVNDDCYVHYYIQQHNTPIGNRLGDIPVYTCSGVKTMAGCWQLTQGESRVKHQFQSTICDSCGLVVEHCVSSANGCGINSQGTHTDKKCIAWMHCKLLWIKASAKCINVNNRGRGLCRTTSLCQKSVNSLIWDWRVYYLWGLKKKHWVDFYYYRVAVYKHISVQTTWKREVCIRWSL